MVKTIINNKEQTVKDFFEEYKLAKVKTSKLLTSKSVLINDQIVVDEEAKLYPQDEVSINFEVIIEKVEMLWHQKVEIVYEDEDILLVNKPSEMLVHSDGNKDNNLTAAVNFYLHRTGNSLPAYCIHRLDFETSGLVLFAKNPLALSFLSYQMESMQITKKYIAVVEGVFHPLEGTIEFNIGRNRHASNCYRVNPNGKEAITKYQTLEKSKQKSLVRAEIITGRTHQIRVHFSYLHHPIIGDKLYGNAQGKLMLFSQALHFIHPQTKQMFDFELEIPKDFWVIKNG
jgi:23S rRNA pseudouridine1911/1915/1917 synthase